MTPTPSIWNRHQKLYADHALEKSAFIIFVEFCSDMVIDVGEAATLVRQRWSLKPSIFHLSDEVALELARAIGIAPDLWTKARGAHLLAGRVGKRVFVSDLRYCCTCLTLGNHSALFQLPQVVHCPIHEEPLKMGCPHCGKPVFTNALAIARNHLYCGACNRNFASERRREALGAPIGHPPTGPFAALGRAVVEQTLAGSFRSQLRWDKSPAQIAANPALVRVHHRHMVWGDPSMGRGFLRFKTETIRLNTEEAPPSRPRFYGLVRDAATTALEELAAQLGRHVRFKEAPLGVEEAMFSAVRLDLRVSAVAAAFWRSAAAFNVHRYVLGEMPPPAAKAPSFLSWLPDHTGAMRLVVRSMVRALFVHSLIRMRRLRYGVQVAWSDLPDESLFLSPWRLRAVEKSGQLELQIRTRADVNVVDRLASRYRRHWLLEAPEGVSNLELVTSAAGGVPAVPSGENQEHASWAGRSTSTTTGPSGSVHPSGAGAEQDARRTG